MGVKQGQNCIIGENVVFGDNVALGHNVIVEDNVFVGSDSYIDSNTILRKNTKLGTNSFVGANCIIGEYQMDFCLTRKEYSHELTIGDNALIRSETIIYTGSKLGNNFQTGHRVTIRERSNIGDNVSIGTLSDIQGNCTIGNYVRMHSNVHVGQLSKIDDFVWIFPYVVLTNDPTPPSDNLVGVHINTFAIVATSSVVLPGIEIGQDALVAAGAIVTKNVDNHAVVGGNPAKVLTDVRQIKNKVTGELAYPWREHFRNHMPWSENDFETWYASLDLSTKQTYNIENILK